MDKKVEEFPANQDEILVSIDLNFIYIRYRYLAF